MVVQVLHGIADHPRIEGRTAQLPAERFGDAELRRRDLVFLRHGHRMTQRSGEQTVEAPHDVLRRGPPVRRMLGQASQYDLLKRRGNRTPVLARRQRIAPEMRRHQLDRRGRGERRHTRQKLIRQHAEGVEIGAMIHVRIARRLLGCHVRRTAHRDSRCRDRGTHHRLAHGARDPEIGHLRVPRGEEDVLRLDVPVHDPLRVRVRQRIGDFAHDPDRFLHRQLALARQPGAQALPRHVRHHVVQHPGGFAGLDQPQNVRVLQLSDDADLAQKPLGA